MPLCKHEFGDKSAFFVWFLERIMRFLLLFFRIFQHQKTIQTIIFQSKSKVKAWTFNEVLYLEFKGLILLRNIVTHWLCDDCDVCFLCLLLVKVMAWAPYFSIDFLRFECCEKHFLRNFTWFLWILYHIYALIICISDAERFVHHQILTKQMAPTF